MKTLALLGIASLVAAALAFLGNRWVLSRLGPGGVALAVPWWEEACKFGAAALVPAVPILYVHLLFGALELAYDWRCGEPETRFLGLLSLSVHGLVGSVALLTLDGGLSWPAAYLAAGVTHTLCNLAVLFLVLPALGADIPASSGKR